MKRIAFLTAAALTLAVLTVPAYATPKAPTSPKNCVPHAVSYRVSGPLTVPGALVANTDGTYNGTLTVQVLRSNWHARADKGTTKPYTLVNAKVKFGNGVDKTTPAAGTKAKLKGTITFEPKKCGPFTPTITIKKVRLHLPHA
jgi:hypothetical protein